MSGLKQSPGGREEWKPRPGNYFISPGTWVRDRLGGMHERGVVSEILEVHEGGTVKILWYPNSTEYLSTPSFRKKLRDGRLVIDDGQHPYDKLDWGSSRGDRDD